MVVRWLLRMTGSVLLLTLGAVCLVLAVGFVLWMLPLIVCERFRLVRLLIPLTAVYYSAGCALGIGLLRWSPTDVTLFTAFGVLRSIPAGPLTFFLSPRKRRAVLAAIRHHERLGGR